MGNGGTHVGFEVGFESCVVHGAHGGDGCSGSFPKEQVCSIVSGSVCSLFVLGGVVKNLVSLL
jgi:hypothetical protein